MTQPEPALTLHRIDATTLEALVHEAGLRVPVEQAGIWDAYDTAVPGRSPWARLTARTADGTDVAVISLSAYQGRGFTYLWAKHGPVWLSEPSAAAEKALRDALRDFVRKADPKVVMVRMHVHHEARDLKPLLQTVTYDETVTVDLTASEEDMMAAMSKTGRKKLRRTLRDEGFVLTEERGISAEGFAELYAIYKETAQRDGFGIYPANVYLTMLSSLGDAARLFVARRSDGPGAPGRAVSWVLGTFYDGVGQDYYGGSNAEGFDTNAALRLKWHILTSLKAEGGVHYDMMGVGSAKAPQLMGVRQFKLQFAEQTTAVDPSWDVVVKPLTYKALSVALAAKRLLTRLRRS